MKIEAPEVTLVDSMGSDLSVCNAARVSFNKESEWEYPDVKTERCTDFSYERRELSVADQKLIKYLAKHNHFTPFCHAFLSFRIKASIAVARQLVKHQVGLSWNEVSRRYVSDEPSFYMPESWRTRPENVKQGSSETETVTKLKLDGIRATQSVPLIEDAVWNHYQNCLDLYEGLLESGVAPEQARLVLPVGSNTEWIWSGSIAAFARVYNLRIDPHAQKETRDVAKMIGDLVPSQYQHTWAALTDKT